MPDGEQLIGRKTIDLLRDNQFNADQLKELRNFYNAGYGYGLGVRTMMGRALGNSNGTPGEFGWTGAMGTYTLIDPGRKLYDDLYASDDAEYGGVSSSARARRSVRYAALTIDL